MLTSSLQRVAHFVDQLSDWIGRSVAWLTLFMVLTQFTVVVLRYMFNVGWIAMQESILYMHALVFMLGAAYTLRQDGHVRIDIFYHRLGYRSKAWVDIFGTVLLLLPVCLFIFSYSLDYVSSAWLLNESSREAGGLPGLFLLKTSLLLMPSLLALQGLSILFRNILIVSGITRPGEGEHG